MKMTLPKAYQARPFTPADAPAVVELFSIYSLATTGAIDFTLEEFQLECQTEGFHPETDILIIAAPDGRVVGYEEYWNPYEPHVHIQSYGCVHPDHQGQGIGMYLVRVPGGRRVDPDAVPTAKLFKIEVPHLLIVLETAFVVYLQDILDPLKSLFRRDIDENGQVGVDLVFKKKSPGYLFQVPQHVKMVGIAFNPRIGKRGYARLLAEDDLVCVKRRAHYVGEYFRAHRTFKKEVRTDILAERPVKNVLHAQFFGSAGIGICTFNDIVIKFGERLVQGDDTRLHLLS